MNKKPRFSKFTSYQQIHFKKTNGDQVDNNQQVVSQSSISSKENEKNKETGYDNSGDVERFHLIKM